MFLIVKSRMYFQTIETYFEVCNLKYVLIWNIFLEMYFI